MKSAHYELKQIYHGLLQADPDYPAWQDFEYKNCNTWYRYRSQPMWGPNADIRYNPLHKKWEPEGGWTVAKVKVTSLTDEDFAKLQAYAKRLSFEREMGAVTDEKWLEMVKNGEV